MSLEKERGYPGPKMLLGGASRTGVQSVGFNGSTASIYGEIIHRGRGCLHPEIVLAYIDAFEVFRSRQ